MRTCATFILIFAGGWLLWHSASTVSSDAALVAAHRGNLATLRRAAPEQIDACERMSLIHYAVWGERPDAVRLLLDRGADANALWHEQTPLAAAVATGEPAVVRLLLDHSAHPDAGCPAGWTPLMLAVSREDATCTRPDRGRGRRPGRQRREAQRDRHRGSQWQLRAARGPDGRRGKRSCPLALIARD